MGVYGANGDSGSGYEDWNDAQGPDWGEWGKSSDWWMQKYGEAIKASKKPAFQAKQYFETALKPFFESAKADTEYFGQAAIAAQKDALERIPQQYREARAGVAQQGRVGTQQILDAQSRAMAASQQAAIDAGLSGSTAQVAAGRGVSADTSRALAGLQAGLGQLYSSLDVGQAQAEQAGAAQLSGLLQGQASSAQNLLGLAFSGMNQSVIEQDSGGGSGVGGLLATALGSGLGAFLASDDRLKNKIGPIHDSLDRVDEIETFYYQLNDVASLAGGDTTKRQVGVSAQSVLGVLPEALSRVPIDGTDYLAVEYQRLIPLLVSAIQDLRSQVVDLQHQAQVAADGVSS